MALFWHVFDYDKANKYYKKKKICVCMISKTQNYNRLDHIRYNFINP